MKAIYKILFVGALIYVASTFQAKAQDGFESYEVGSVPSIISEIGVDGGAKVEVTTDDKWAGLKSLVLRDKVGTTSWKPYAMFPINVSEGNAEVSFYAKVPEGGWLNIFFRDEANVDGPHVTLYGTWGSVGQTFQGGGMKTDQGTDFLFPTDSWCKVTMSMIVGTGFNNKFNLKVEEVEWPNPVTYTATAVDIITNPWVTPNKLSGSLANGKFILASGKDPQDFPADIFIDDLKLPGVISAIDNVESHSTELSLSPNPNRGQLNVRSIIKDNTVSTLEIYDISGKLMLQDTKFKGIKTYNLNNFSNGIYSVRIYSVDGYSTKRLILEK